MTLIIREANESDYSAVAALLTAGIPRQPVTVEMLQRSREKTLNSSLDLHLAQWMAEQDGVPVGFMGIMQWAGWFHPDRYMLQLAVDPACSRRGVGTQLARQAETHLRGRQAQELFAWADEDQPHALNFLTQRGFTESAREFKSVLKLAGFKWTTWEPRLHLPAGYTRLNYPQFAQQFGTQQALTAFTDLFNQGRLDSPHTIKPRLYTKAEVQEYLNHPTAFPEGIGLAVTEKGELAALSELWLDPTNPKALQTGHTATHRNHRRQGLAVALKLAGIQEAQGRGITEIHTSNDSKNVGMLAINRALGFQAFPAHIEMKWEEQ